MTSQIDRSVATRKITAWYGKLETAEPYPDIAYWRSQSDEAIFDAAWQMGVDAHSKRISTYG